MDGKALAERIRAEVAQEAKAFDSLGLATVLVGDDPASEIYIRRKHEAAREAGITAHDHHLPAETAEQELLALVAQLNANDDVDGILVQLPLPDGIDQDAVIAAIDPAKDVDGLTPISTGLLVKGLPGLRPCTPSGVMELLRRHDVSLEGAEAVVVGRSDLVGKPISALLLAANATVTTCHSRTRDLAAVCRRADVLVAAVGRPEFVQGDWVKEGATVIDVGINRTDAGLVGDVAYAAAAERARLITPVPGGVGPMTIAMLLRNTLLAARAAAEEPVGAGWS